MVRGSWLFLFWVHPNLGLKVRVVVADQPLYEPIMSTLVAGLKPYASRHPEVDVKVSIARSGRAIEGAIDRAGAGDVIVWVGFHLSNVAFAHMRAAHRCGAYVVYYRTEPRERCRSRTADGIDETWEYTYAHVAALARCPGPGADKSVSRYLPPGALPRLRVLPVPGRPGPPPLVLFGNWSPHREALKAMFSAAQISLTTVSGKTTRREVEDALGEVLVAIETPRLPPVRHGAAERGGQPIAATRVSTLLNYGRLVLAEHAHAQDEQAWAGLITFVQRDELAEAYRKACAEHLPLTLSANGSSVPRAALEAEQAALTARQRADFQRRFAAEVLFERAGIYALFDSLVQREQGGGGVPQGCENRTRDRKGFTVLRLNGPGSKETKPRPPRGLTIPIV
jgi:hypothetical protein